jgi:hypothetical protein
MRNEKAKMQIQNKLGLQTQSKVGRDCSTTVINPAQQGVIPFCFLSFFLLKVSNFLVICTTPTRFILGVERARIRNENTKIMNTEC